MKRYTERIRENEYATSNAIIEELKIDENNEDKDYILEQQKNIINTLNQKLGKLEDLEEDLGCPLEVRDRALKQEVIYYEENGKLLEVIAMTCNWKNYRKTKICVFNCLYDSNYTTRVLEIKTSDYKKTWWLKESKEE